ncbi:hypothetical protein [Hydrocarboniphaga effusa]|jgi:hypothetical protein|uniref:hypothetical protein n=1 Tax=Hydrocarboniphaga effusa TaxID=243629 RepID=UPI00398C04AD
MLRAARTPYTIQALAFRPCGATINMRFLSVKAGEAQWHRIKIIDRLILYTPAKKLRIF